MMALPKVVVPTFDVTLPESEEVIKCRPFLVKESKILTLAVESEDKLGMLSACKQVVGNCVEGIDVDELPLHILQWLFLKLKEKSTGEQQSFELICGECSNKIGYEMSVNDFQMIGNTAEPNKKILLNESSGMVMKYPSSEVQVNFENMSDTDILVSCIEYIFDDEEVTKPDEDNREEIVEWVDGLTLEAYGEAEEFLSAIPTIAHNIEFDCPKCGHHNEIVINGYEHFFV
jgi:hypothetical protein